MEKDSNMRWLGNGVLVKNGVDYAYGDRIPIDEIDSDQLAIWELQGLIGSLEKPNIKAIKERLEEEREDLRKMVTGLIVEYEAMAAEKARFESKQKRRSVTVRMV